MSGGKLHLVRHAEGLHNLFNDPNLRDPALTERAHYRAEELGSKFAEANSNTVGLIMSSPLRRTIDTTLLAFPNILNRRYYAADSSRGAVDGIDLILEPDVRETVDLPCNTGSDPATLKSWFPGLDFSSLSVNWFQGPGGRPEKQADVTARAASVREMLKEEIAGMQNAARKNIIVVTHSGFIAALIGASNVQIPVASYMSFVFKTDISGKAVLLAV